MRKKNTEEVYSIIKNFLLTVFVIMCITALITGTAYAKSVTRHRIDGSESETVSAENIISSAKSILENLYR